MYKHELKITVRRPGEEPISIAKFKKLPILERLHHRWLRNAQKLSHRTAFIRLKSRRFNFGI